MAVWDSYIHNSGSTLNLSENSIEYLPGNPTGLQGILEDSDKFRVEPEL